MNRSLSVVLLMMAACAAGEDLERTAVVGEAVTALAGVPTWQPLTNPAPFAAGVSLLLTDGTLMVQNFGTSNWWRLTPDQTGTIGKTVSAQELRELNIERDAFHGDWNYVLRPREHA